MRPLRWAAAGMRAAWRRTSVVNLIVTRRCDLACSYCHARGKGPELTVADWLRIAKRLSRRYAVFTVSGGEPLLFRELPALINGLSEIGLAGLCTNARRLEASHLEAMRGLDYLNFSIDTTAADAVSPKTAYGKLEMMSEYARRQRFELRGTMVVTYRNVDRLGAVVEALARHGIPLNLQLVQRPGPEDAFDSAERLERLAALQREVVTLKRNGAAIDEPDDYIAGFAAFAAGSKAVDCLAGMSYLAVDADGRAMPCQDTAAAGPPLHLDSTDVDAVLRELPRAIPAGCRCWWNCYHRNAAWSRNPAAFVAASAVDALRPQRRPPGC